MTRRLPYQLLLALIVILAGGWMPPTGHSQDHPLGGAARLPLDIAALPGIDRGLRDNDPPMEPGGISAQWLEAAQREDGHRISGSYVPGSVIVKFKPGVSAAAKATAMNVVKGTDLDRQSWADFEIMDIPIDADVEAVAAELRARSDVEYAQPRYYVRPTAFRPNDPLYAQQWSFPALDMERAWEIQPGATSDIIVAVIDTGAAFQNRVVRYNAPAWRLVDAGGNTVLGPFPALGLIDVPFAAAPELGSTKFVAPRDFVWNDELPFDLEGHGTHVSGTIGQLTNNGVGVAGMAFNVRIMPIKVIVSLWDQVLRAPGPGTEDVVARGIRYAVDNGAKVINMSIGRTGGGAPVAVEEAIRFAVSRGVFVVVSAGNSFESGNTPNRLAESAPNIAGYVAVGAVGRNLERSYFSTTNVYVELAAPGGNQRAPFGTTGGILQQTIEQSSLHTYAGGPATYRAPRGDFFTFEFFQGTSMAAPHVSGFAALLMQQGITSPAAIEAAMKQYARDLGRAGVDTDYGSGLIQPRATLRGLGLAR